jgi:hypothetical protein
MQSILRNKGRGSLTSRPVLPLRAEVPGGLGDVVLAVARGDIFDTLGCIAGAPGEPEVEVERTLVREALAPDENEIVHREEVAKVAVGQRAVMRRIAPSLEPVELERGERIERRDLVVDEHAPAWRATRTSSEKASSGRFT